MWSSLPSNLRAVLGTALVLGIGVAAAAFTLSFFALREAADNPALKFGQGHAWLFPIGVDMALIFFEVLLLGASMVRIEERGRVVQYPRAIPFMLVMVAAAGTLYFNATRVPDTNGLRLIALAVPVASILVTLGLAYLLKMLAAASGADAIHLAPPSMEPRRIVRRADTLEGEIIRPDMETSSGPGSELGQDGHNGHSVGGEALAVYGAKRLHVERYLAEHPEVAGAKPRAIAAAINRQGQVSVSERYVGDILEQRRSAQKR